MCDFSAARMKNALKRAFCKYRSDIHDNPNVIYFIVEWKSQTRGSEGRTSTN